MWNRRKKKKMIQHNAHWTGISHICVWINLFKFSLGRLTKNVFRSVGKKQHTKKLAKSNINMAKVLNRMPYLSRKNTIIITGIFTCNPCDIYQIHVSFTPASLTFLTTIFPLSICQSYNHCNGVRRATASYPWKVITNIIQSFIFYIFFLLLLLPSLILL